MMQEDLTEILPAIKEDPMNSSISAINDQNFTALIEENPLKSANLATIEQKSSAIYCEFKELPWISAKLERNSTEKEEQPIKNLQSCYEHKDSETTLLIH
ncbi:hypothetical protein L1887_08206 [Cichorium endivia]|nr:hypothetical protein L1887_08206 [Cichorium endivia]